MLLSALKNNWPLFFGTLLIMIGAGLHGTLLGVRAEIEGFDTLMIGILMACYYIGYLLGFFFAPNLVWSVGHIRVFAALASLASAVVMFHGLFINPYIWAAARILTGFCYAGLFIVIESWLNNSATNKTRGSVLALYLIATYAGLMLGQFLLNLTDPASLELFVVTSIIISLAMLPLSLRKSDGPVLGEIETISFVELYKISPLGVFGILMSGMTSSVILGMGAVYGSLLDLSIPQISFMMASFLLGGVALPMPIGWLSDRINRRLVLIITSLCISGLCVLGYIVPISFFYGYLLITFLIGGLSFSCYGLCAAQTNDHLRPSQILSAGSTMIFLNGLGACFGPIIVSFAMNTWSIESYMLSIAAFNILTVIFGIYRSSQTTSMPVSEQSDYIDAPATASPVLMQIVEPEAPTKHDI